MTEEQKTFHLELSTEVMNVVLMGLGELPAKVSLEAIIEIKKQCQSQPKPTEE